MENRHYTTNRRQVQYAKQLYIYNRCVFVLKILDLFSNCILVWSCHHVDEDKGRGKEYDIICSGNFCVIVNNGVATAVITSWRLADSRWVLCVYI